ncbi:MAG: helix-turn-helix domain-containing protein [Ilumatobacteraceae bacterium]|nr:helix-turn-helix domain-containing protein [Ilumatobacter sp.]MCO5330664.1 helix-turn-helix domain-containing protein [Ilumatobacteraceae bacterium]
MDEPQDTPDYQLADLQVITTTEEIRAGFHPLRSTVLDLLMERAATVAELAAAVKRPKSTVAHHVKVLLQAGLLQVVRTRKVRAIDERWYGRTARTYQVGRISAEQLTLIGNYLADAAAESAPAHAADDLRAVHRHARVPREHAEAFWERVLEVAAEFSRIPREGEETWAFVAGLYPAEHPVLPPPV